MNNNKTSAMSRVIGLIIIVLTSLVLGQRDTFKITCQLQGDVCPGGPTGTYLFGQEFIASSTTYNSTIKAITAAPFSNVPLFWTGKITAKPYKGFVVTPKDTSIFEITKNFTIVFSVKDTLKPVVKIDHIKDTIIYVNKLFTFIDYIQENTQRVKSIRMNFSTDSGKVWDSISYQQWGPPNYFRVFNNVFTSYPLSFTPIAISENYMLRVITTDCFNIADTSIVTIKVRNFVGINTPQTIQPHSNQINHGISYDLLGRKSLTKSFKLYIN